MTKKIATTKIRNTKLIKRSQMTEPGFY